ncbi:MAG: TlpA family protein disulfide reductase [Phycisphaeraceae bacterium]|nr:TlpA family protein disulfide reductase [Phycisphaerales bacterium]MCB9859504.1 TlpA family protein disulfide reductase [Phycisphaeraceae bacterium]
MCTRSSGIRSVFACSLLAVSAVHADPTREGSGQRRTDLDAMELHAMPIEAWAGLSDWVGGSADATSTKGKVVLFYTWSSWYDRSMRQMSMVDRVAKEYADKGLVVIGVHDARGWDAGKEEITKAGISFPVAHDADGKFRAALKVDQDPDFYLIDRAGNLRFADITTSSVSEAVETLVKETEEKAGGILDEMARKEAAAREAAKKTSTIHQGVDIADIPENLGISRPRQVLFDAAQWPARVTRWERETLGISNSGFGEESIDRQLSLPQNQQWLNDRRPNTKARVIVAYIWNPGEYKSFHRVQEKMEELQKKYQREVVVVGVVSQFKSGNQFNSFGNENAEREERERMQLLAHWEKLGKSTKFTHYNILDTEHAVFDALYGGSSPFGGNANGDPAPIAMIFSSDGVMRWVGNPDHELFDLSIDRVVSVDPWVKERRKVESDWIKSQQDSSGGE